MRVLIIEDEKKLADSIKKGLEQESYAVDTAYEGSYVKGHFLHFNHRVRLKNDHIRVLPVVLPGLL